MASAAAMVCKLLKFNIQTTGHPSEYMTNDTQTCIGLFLMAARYCCLHCTASREHMTIPKDEREPSPARTLQTIIDDFHKYEADGSRRSRAKDISHSIVARPFLEIDTDHVC